MESKTLSECKQDGYQMALSFMARFRTAQQMGKNKISSVFSALRG